MREETLLEEFSKRGIFLERGIGIKYTREDSFFSSRSNGNISYTTADGANEVIFCIYNDSVEDINVRGPAARHIEEVYREIETHYLRGGESRFWPAF